MPLRCTVPGCKSNYSSTIKETGSITCFRFPRDEKLRKLWIQAIQKEDWTPTKYAVVCVLHFQSNDVITYQNFVNCDGTITKIQKRPTLAFGAIPCIFPKLPPRLRKPCKRKNRNILEDRYVQLNESNVSKFEINNFDVFYEKFETKLNLKKWFLKNGNCGIYFYQLNDCEDGEFNLDVKCSIFISKDLDIEVHVGNNKEEIKSQDDPDRPPEPKLKEWSQMEELLKKYENPTV